MQTHSHNQAVTTVYSIMLSKHTDDSPRYFCPRLSELSVARTSIPTGFGRDWKDLFSVASSVGSHKINNTHVGQEEMTDRQTVGIRRPSQ